MSLEDHDKTLLELTVQIVAAHVGQNQVAPAALPSLIEQVHSALRNVGQAPAPAPAEKKQPFVAAKRSIFPDYIICLEDGRKLKTLKRHLRSTFGLSPDQYRDKWGLPPDYPMVAPSYAQHRSRLAKQLGLGRKAPDSAESVEEAEPIEESVPEPREVVHEPAREPRRRTEHTAASVFAKFPDKASEPEAEQEDAAELPGPKKRGRKPFSKQLARTMPR